MEFILPASPNWYCSRVLDCNDRGICCVGAKNSLYLWDICNAPPKCISYITAHSERVIGVSLSPTCEGIDAISSQIRCCSAGEDGKVKIWDLKNKLVITEHDQHKYKLTSVHWSPVNENMVASGDEKGYIVLWNLSSGDLWTLQPDFSNSYIFCLSFSPYAANLLAVGFKNGSVHIINVTKKNSHVVQRLRGHDDEVHSIAWCPQILPKEDDVVVVATSSRSKTIRLWNSMNGELMQTLTIPNGTGYRRRERVEESGTKQRIWIALCWPRSSPTEFVSSGINGELILWNISQLEKPKWQFLSSGATTRSHNRIVFNIACGGLDHKTLVSISMDRQMIVWDLVNQSSQQMIATLGGFVYSLVQSPINPERFAIGVGDCLIRVCNLDSQTYSNDFQIFWQGIKSKVIVLAWHPTKEGILAYGTEDGRVGIYDILSQRPPQLCYTYHKKTVYVVAWGPQCGENSAECDYSLYSVGDCIIYQHKHSQLDKPAEDINVIIKKTNHINQKIPGHSELSWSTDHSYVAIGNEDGSIDIYVPPLLKHVCTIHVHRKLINCLRWHPQYTVESNNMSRCRYWLASGSNESTIHVFDLQKVLSKSSSDADSEAANITESFCQLEGHTSRITSLCWSLHRDGYLVSSSYDWTVQVWDVTQGLAVKNYRGHHGHVLCVQWGVNDPDIIYSGSDDYTVHSWRISQQVYSMPPTGHDKQKTKSKQKSKWKSVADDQKPVRSESSASAPSENVDADTNARESSNDVDEKQESLDVDQLKHLLEQKRHEILLAASVNLSPPSDSENVSAAETRVVQAETVEDILGQTLFPVKSILSSQQSEDPFMTKAGDTSKKDRKKRRAKSLFPKSSAADNRGKQPSQQDCIDFATIKYSDVKLSLSEGQMHLGCFIGRRDTYSLFKHEELYHLEHENFEQHMTLEVFKGSIGNTLKLAADRGELNDHLMAMAPLASIECWEEMCVQYANQLVKDGLHHKAATYFLAANQVYEAINMFKDNRLYKDAVCLARVRLSPFDPLLNDLYVSWGSHLAKDGNYELAAKCFLAAGDAKESAVCLSKRPELSALRAATFVSLASGDIEAAKVYAQKYVQESIMQSDWSGTDELIRASPSFMALALTLSVYEILANELTALNLLTDIVLGDMNAGNIFKSTDKSRKMPAFLLDADLLDPLCIWKPLQINSEAFLIHILRTWYETWNICLRVSNLNILYKDLLCLHEAKQSQSDDRQMLLEASLNIALCTLKLILCEPECSANWMIKAISLYDKDNHRKIQQSLCRLLLPQGPRYFLNLGRQLCALRVSTLSGDDANEQTMWMLDIKYKHFPDESGDHRKQEPTISDDICTYSQECNAFDCLTAVYSSALLKSLLPSDCGSCLDPKSSDNFQDDCTNDIKASENMAADISIARCQNDIINCDYIKKLSRTLLWDVQIRRRQLLDSIDYVKNAFASLVTNHRTDKENKNSSFCPDSKLQVFGQHEDMDDELNSPSRRRRYSGEYLPMMSQERIMLEESTAPTSRKQEKSLVGSQEEYVAMETMNPKCTSECVKMDDFDPYLIDTAVSLCKQSDIETISKASQLSSDLSSSATVVDDDYIKQDSVESDILDATLSLTETLSKNSNPPKTTSCTDFKPIKSSDTNRYDGLPNDWYEMTNDKKYSLSYITVSVLTKELNRITVELNHLPLTETFPDQLNSTKSLLLLTNDCAQNTPEQSERNALVDLFENLRHWGSHHAYLSEWKEYFSTLSL